MQTLQPTKTLVEKVYDTILDALCDGTFKPGERLTQEDIAARLNVSRQPVTHAIALLKDQAFLAAHGRQGVTVTEVDKDFFREIYELRAAIEPLAVQLATHRLGAADISKGREIIKEGQRMLALGDSDGALKADIAFHRFIHTLSANSLIVRTMDYLGNHLRFGMRQVLRTPGMSNGVWQEHSEILEQMIGGNAEAAANAMRRHLLDAFERVGRPEDGHGLKPTRPI
jgi:DNA-binding GntR family transcriptional regulator